MNTRQAAETAKNWISMILSLVAVFGMVWLLTGSRTEFSGTRLEALEGSRDSMVNVLRKREDFEQSASRFLCRLDYSNAVLSGLPCPSLGVPR